MPSRSAQALRPPQSIALLSRLSIIRPLCAQALPKPRATAIRAFTYARNAATPNKTTTSSATAAKAPARPALPPVKKSTFPAGGVFNPANRSPSSQPTDDLPIDPQPAAVPPSSVAEVDPSLRIPTPSSGMTPLSPPAQYGQASAITQAYVPGSSNGSSIDWSSSYHGLSTVPFSPEQAAVLMQKLQDEDIEIKPDGILYLPEIKYRRILNQAFGPGGWGLAPRGPPVVTDKNVTQEYALVVHGRFIAQARGECHYFGEDMIPTAQEGCKSNALLRCCKDLGVASELWDPRFLRVFRKMHCHEIWVEHVVNKKKRQIWKRKDCDAQYPYQLAK